MVTSSTLFGLASALGTAVLATASARAWRSLVDADPICVPVDGPGDALSSAHVGTALAAADHPPAA